MKKLNKEELYYPKNADFKKVLEDMVDSINRYDGDMGSVGMQYIVGEIFGGKLMLVFSPNASICDVLETDGVNGFGYCLVTDDK